MQRTQGVPVPPSTRRALAHLAIASVGIGMLAFAAQDVLFARASYLDLDAAREATTPSNWRTSGVPALPLGPVLDVIGAAGGIFLIVLAVTRNLPPERRRAVHIAIGFFLAGIVVSFARNAIDRTHDHEGAWGALQLGLVGLALLSLTWHALPARALGIAGAIVITLRQPMIWRAGDEYVRASGDAAAAYGAELAKLAAHSVGATGALLLAIALFLAVTMPPSVGSSARRETVGAPAARAETDLEPRAQRAP